MIGQYLRYADVIVHVVSRDTTTEGDVESYFSQSIRTKAENIPIVFAVNKIDLGDDFPMDYIYNAVKKSGVTNYSIVKTSAKTGEGVAELFDEVIKRVESDTMEYVKKILSKDKDILKQYPVEVPCDAVLTRRMPLSTKKKCLVM